MRNNKPYCQRHYKTPVGGGVKSTSVCAGCGDYIEGRAATALNQKWHPHHFQCVSCKKELSASVPGQFMPHRNQLLLKHNLLTTTSFGHYIHRHVAGQWPS